MPIRGSDGLHFATHVAGYFVQLKEPAPREPPFWSCACGRGDCEHIEQARREYVELFPQADVGDRSGSKAVNMTMG